MLNFLLLLSTSPYQCDFFLAFLSVQQVSVYCSAGSTGYVLLSYYSVKYRCASIVFQCHCAYAVYNFLYGSLVYKASRAVARQCTNSANVRVGVLVKCTIQEGKCIYMYYISACIKGTVPRDFRLLVFFMNQFPPSPSVYH